MVGRLGRRRGDDGDDRETTEMMGRRHGDHRGQHRVSTFNLNITGLGDHLGTTRGRHDCGDHSLTCFRVEKLLKLHEILIKCCLL